MTREEAKDVFLNRGFIEVEGCRGRIFHADKWREACMIISEWLKEEPILEKIKTEIEQIEINGHIRDVECFRAGINTALNVINKYNVESKE